MITTSPGTLISGVSRKNGAHAFVLIAVKQHPKINDQICVLRLGHYGELDSFATLTASAADSVTWKP